MKDKLLMIVFVLVLGSILTASLLAVNNYTEPIIQVNREKTVKSSLLEALDIPFTDENLNKVFSENVREETKGDTTIYYVKTGDIAFKINGSGVWGPIEGVLSLKKDHKPINNLVIIHQEETPGLGGRISDKDFLNRFKGKVIYPKLEIVSAGKAIKDNQVDGITGATLSSKALGALLNSEIKKYTPILSEGTGQ
jgi:Na+-transporting NADH:ubiquinone oxidoreductase subunit C